MKKFEDLILIFWCGLLPVFFLYTLISSVEGYYTHKYSLKFESMNTYVIHSKKLLFLVVNQKNFHHFYYYTDYAIKDYEAGKCYDLTKDNTLKEINNQECLWYNY